MEETILIKKVKRNDDDALNVLIKQYEKMIYKIIFSFNLCQGDYKISKDELFQEGIIAIYEACKTYNKHTDCKFSTYVYLIIKRKITKAIFQSIKIYREECVSIDKNDHFQNSYACETKYIEDNPLNYQDKKTKEAYIDDILQNLNTLDRKIIELRLNNYTNQEICKMLSIPYKKVDNRLQYLRRRNYFRNTKKSIN